MLIEGSEFCIEPAQLSTEIERKKPGYARNTGEHEFHDRHELCMKVGRLRSPRKRFQVTACFIKDKVPFKCTDRGMHILGKEPIQTIVQVL